MRILLIGATGQLGSDLVRNNPGHEIISPPREELDLANAGEGSSAIARIKPDVVINCAAFHNVPLCESQPSAAFLINCIAVRELASACVAHGARLVTFSTDYVFGGSRTAPWREDDRPGPLQVYGISRLAGEHIAIAIAGEAVLVVRTCGLYGSTGARSKGGNFVDGRVAQALAGQQMEIACEQVISPTSTHDLSHAVFRLIAHPQAGGGIYHLVNEGECSWYEFTCEIVRLLGARVNVVPVDRGGRTGEMRRPLYSALANTRARALGIEMRPWREALREYLARKYGLARHQ